MADRDSDMMREDRRLTGAVLDALTSQICILDTAGTIQFVNRAWREFALENGGSPLHDDIGCSYLDVCRVAAGPASEEARAFERGVRDVLEGRSDLFEMEYPCHSPTENRWFLGIVTPLKSELRGAVVLHANITDRKRVEIQLAKLAATDSLTSLPNRRFFLEFANREVRRAQQFGVPASVVMIDIDHFKSINDTYGHATGDEVLRRVAKAFSASIRKSDVIARLGGEEFAILLPGAGEAEARRLSEKLCLDLSESEISIGDNGLRVTASFGVAELSARDATIAASLKRADAALYAAKRAGRNKVMTFHPGQSARALSREPPPKEPSLE